MKRTWPIVIVVLALLLAGGGFLVWKRGQQPPPTVAPAKPEGVLIETLLKERPYVTLTPRADGKEFTMNISRIKNAKTIEYELVYLSNGLSRGTIGSIELKGEDKVERKLLLGTCSRNVCKYDEGVEKGTLTLRFREPGGVRKFVSDFHLQQGNNQLSSVEGKFKAEGKFSSEVFYITMSTVGLPGEIEGKVVGGSYGVFSSGSPKAKGTRVSLELSEEAPQAKLSWWNGRNWEKEEKDFEMEGKTISASVESLTAFIVATSE